VTTRTIALLCLVLGLLGSSLAGCGKDENTKPPAPASSKPKASETATGSALPTPTASMTGSAQSAAFGPFVGTFSGHTRYLEIDKQGRGVEHLGDGCCHPIYDAKIQLTDATRRPWGWVAGFKIIEIKVHDRKEVDSGTKPGSMGTLTLKRGLITSSLDDQTYCSGRAARRALCGA
jgi:hypothetical protein